MKKLIYILFLLPFFAIGQVSNGTEYTEEAFRSTNNQTVTTSDFITTTGTDGTQGKILGENISLSVIPPVTNFTPVTSSIKGYFQGVDNKFGSIVQTTAGITNRIYFTGDITTLSAVNYFTSNAASKGTVATASPTPVSNNDNEKKYFSQDIIGNAFPSISKFPAGAYAGNLTVRVSPNSAQQRYTIEIYKTNNTGTPIASGVTGAAVGSLGVTVVTIIDSGLLNLADNSITNIPISGILTGELTINATERIRYHVSAAKVGTAGANITMEVFYGNSYNSYYDVPVTFDTNSVKDVSTVTNGTGTATDAFNALNIADGQNVKLTGSQTIDGIKSLKQRLFWNRSLDNTPTASVGFSDTGFNFSIDAGGGGSYLTFKNAGVEVGRFSPTSGQFLVGTTTEDVDTSYKLIVNGKARFFNNVYSTNFSDLLGKHWVIFGDSFSNDFPTDYVGVVRDNLGLIANTYAASGASSANQLTELKGQITANPAFLSTYEIISLHIGVNDYANGSIALGDVSSTIGSGSISANIKEFIEVALTNNPLVKVFIITPPEANGGTSGLTYKTNNASGWNLENLSTTISAICKYYSVQCVDLYSLGQFNLKTIPTLTGDGLHPNTAGKTWLGNIVSRSFVSNNTAGVSSVTNQTTSGFVPLSSGNNTFSSFSNSVIKQNGTNVGLSVSAASAKLEMNFNGATQAAIKMNNTTAGSGSGAIQFFDNSVSKWNLTTNAGNDFILYNQDGAAAGQALKIEKSTGILQVNKLAGTGDRLIGAHSDGSVYDTGLIIPVSARYTPTFTSGTNVSAGTLLSHIYTRVGNVVTVIGSTSITMTTGSVASNFTITLPVARTNSTGIGIGFGNLSGAQSTVTSPVIVTSSSTTTANVAVTTTLTGSNTLWYNFSYLTTD